MSRPPDTHSDDRFPHRTIIAAAIAVVALVLIALTAPQAAAQGWLVAFVVWSGVPAGALALTLIHVLTGGRWGHALAPVLRPLMALLPLSVLAFIPIALALPLIFQWTAHAVEPPSLARFYLNAPSFLLRAFVTLGGYSILAFLVLTRRCTRLLAGLGLAFYGLTINLVAVDWILSLQPGFGSSAFGAEIAIQQLLSALALAAVIAPESPGDATTDDLGGLLIAALLGLAYIGLMTFIVDWYGDLPPKAAWYIARSTPSWLGVIATAVGLCVIVPLALLLREGVRHSRRWLRLVGILILAGVTLHVVWLMGAALAPFAMVPAAIVLFFLVCLSDGLIRLLAAPVRRTAHVR